MKALVSTAFMEANDLEDLAAVVVADKSIGQFGIRFRPMLPGRFCCAALRLYACQ